uniref:Sodium-dependent phosphate transport protein 2B n=1 Tax=Monodelphis domestica TaxID=13616 RepID=A0A5F8GGM6_MONDO
MLSHSAHMLCIELTNLSLPLFGCSSSRAFAGATVHDFFNWFSVLVLLPLELITEFLSYLSDKIGHFIKISGEDESPGILKVLTGPITERIIQLDGKIFIDIVIGRETQNKSLIKIWCKTFENVTFSNVSVPSPENCTSPTFCWTEGKVTWTLMNITYRQNITKCKHLFVNTNYNDATVGFILLTFSLFILAISLALIIKILNSELRGPVAEMIKKYINKDFPYPFAWLTGYFTILVGAVLTFTFQSSSVFTSIITPMIGIDMISLERAYPLILGSNIGTSTITILAALSGPRNALRKSFQVTLCHFLFNLFGIILWYPIPGMRLPVHSARRLGNLTATYRWFAIVYVIFCFFVLPTLAFCFSIADTTVLISVGIPMFFLPFIVVYLHAFNLLHLLPLWMTSLKPWDDLIISIMNLCTQCGENISHKCKNSKLNRFIARRSLPTIKTDLGPDQNQRHSSIRDRLFYVKKSDDTVKEIQSTNDTVTEIQSANQQFSINDASTD